MTPAWTAAVAIKALCPHRPYVGCPCTSWRSVAWPPLYWFSERTWVGHYASFLLTFCAAGMILGHPTGPDNEWRSVRRAPILFAASTVFASEAGKAFGRDGVDWVKTFGVFL